MSRLTVNECRGEFFLGKFRIAWQNQDEDFPGFTIISYGNYNIELGCIDQDRPGIYLTAYEDGGVRPIKSLLVL